MQAVETLNRDFLEWKVKQAKKAGKNRLVASWNVNDNEIFTPILT